MTNDLQQARVEAAAKAMYELRAKIDDPFWEGGKLDYGIKQIYRQDTRAALAAADAVSSKHFATSPERNKDGADSFHVSTIGAVARTLRAVAGHDLAIVMSYRESVHLAEAVLEMLESSETPGDMPTEDAVGFIDRTLDNIYSFPDAPWQAYEVREMLNAIRAMLMGGEVAGDE